MNKQSCNSISLVISQFTLDSRFARAGRRLEPVYMKGGGPQVGEVTSLGRITRLSLQSLIWLPAPIM